MPDFYFEDYDRKEREEKPAVCCRDIAILCVIIVGFIIFYQIYWFILEHMLGSVSSHGLELVAIGLFFALIISVYYVRNKSLEKRRIMAAS